MIHETTIEDCTVQGVRLFEMRHVVDRVRGDLTALEFTRDLPFVPQRIFMTYGIPSECTRGEHAHRQCAQFLVCVHGQCHLGVDDGKNREEFCLNRPTHGVLVPPMVWAREHLHSADSVLLVLASHPYEAGDYIRDYSEFLGIVKGWKKTS
ncbi:sugar 3,4-ketoisomerase [Prosthecobacter sp.]|uniref:sugar 3,4-ketoisomerase n=1 Tax=Prosthecobacter sp. TaxID=1965333 RepID=UPI003783C02C